MESILAISLTFKFSFVYFLAGCQHAWRGWWHDMHCALFSIWSTPGNLLIYLGSIGILVLQGCYFLFLYVTYIIWSVFGCRSWRELLELLLQEEWSPQKRVSLCSVEMLLLAQKDSPSMKYRGKTLKRFHCSSIQLGMDMRFNGKGAAWRRTTAGMKLCKRTLPLRFKSRRIKELVSMDADRIIYHIASILSMIIVFCVPWNSCSGSQDHALLQSMFFFCNEYHTLLFFEVKFICNPYW